MHSPLFAYFWRCFLTIACYYQPDVALLNSVTERTSVRRNSRLIVAMERRTKKIIKRRAHVSKRATTLNIELKNFELIYGYC
jgi:hypothetical protein